MTVMDRREDDVAHGMGDRLDCKFYLLSAQLYYIHCSLDQVTSDIAVSDFPDYVLRMTEEDEHSNSMLAQEYHVYFK